MHQSALIDAKPASLSFHDRFSKIRGTLNSQGPWSPGHLRCMG